MKILATAPLAALIVGAVLTVPVSAKTVLPMADRDACLGMSAPRPKVSPAQIDTLKARSQRPNDSGLGLVSMVQDLHWILVNEFYVEQCMLRAQGQPYDRSCPRQTIPISDAIDLVPATAFTVTKTEFQELLRSVGDDLKAARRAAKQACAQ